MTISTTIREYCPACGFQKDRIPSLQTYVGFCCDGYMRKLTPAVDVVFYRLEFIDTKNGSLGVGYATDVESAKLPPLGS